LLARAVAAATPAQLAILDRVGAPDLDDSDVAEIQQVIVDSGALDALEAHISALTAEAVAALDTLELDGEASAELIALADYVVGRVV
jgi:geranylgeranyl diphosphate synthase type I